MGVVVDLIRPASSAPVVSDNSYLLYAYSFDASNSLVSYDTEGTTQAILHDGVALQEGVARFAYNPDNGIVPYIHLIDTTIGELPAVTIEAWATFEADNDPDNDPSCSLLVQSAIHWN
jgi:hypothetical protein